MSHRTTAAKSHARQERDVRAFGAAGPGGVALSAPAYGIDFVDRPPAGDGPLQFMAPGRSGLPQDLKAGIEHLSGMSMDDVRVHYDSPRPAQMKALAYAQGRDIHLASGQERHLPHEAWHVVQQRAARVRGPSGPGLAVVQDRELEAEADRMGQRAASLGGAVQAKASASADAIPTTHATSFLHVGVTGVIQPKGDVVEDIVLEGYKKDEKELKANLTNCIQKFRSAVDKAMKSDDQQTKDQITEEMSVDGRDAFFYRRLWWKNRRGLLGDLERWEASWSVARTGGLLADLGLALRNVDEFAKGKQFDEIMNKEYLQRGSNQVRGRSDETTTPWSEDLAQSSIKGNAGPSSTTTQLLHVVTGIGGFTTDEVESMMVALVKFWKQGTKRAFGGGFHTAVEVWAPYTGYLEATDQVGK